jgi:uncharacterized protein (DUF885 family)
MSTTISANIQLWRKKVADGTITPDEQREAIAAIRKERISASETSTASKVRKGAGKAAKANSGDLLSELGI